MSRKVTKSIICVVILAAIIGVGVGVYLHYNQGPIVGKIVYGQKYYLQDIRPTERFAGATMNSASYFEINYDKKTGKLYLAGLEATTAPIPFIVTNYKEGVKQTTIEFEYLIDQGEETQLQHLQAVSDDSGIRIKAVESHGVEVIQQNVDKDLQSLDYEVTILFFAKPEAA
ncbi:MAG: hypothetical protein NC133_00580 [Prevotella sp.]|nr:hypothetical protein [Prevotella sp.]